MFVPLYFCIICAFVQRYIMCKRLFHSLENIESLDTFGTAEQKAEEMKHWYDDYCTLWTKSQTIMERMKIVVMVLLVYITFWLWNFANDHFHISVFDLTIINAFTIP